MEEHPYTKEMHEALMDTLKSLSESNRLLHIQSLALFYLFKAFTVYYFLGQENWEDEAELFRGWVCRNLELHAGNEFEAEATLCLTEQVDEVLNLVRASYPQSSLEV